MSNSNSLFPLLILTLTLTLLLPTALTLSQPKPIQALLKHLDSKRASPSVQEAAAKAVLKRLLIQINVFPMTLKIEEEEVQPIEVVHLASFEDFIFKTSTLLHFSIRLLYECMA